MNERDQSYSRYAHREIMRPDEKAMAKNIESDRAVRGSVKAAAGLLAPLTVGAGAGIASKIAPFLSEYVPLDLAIKGINKISPRLGAMLRKGQDSGLDISEGLDFLKEKMGLKPKSEENPEMQQGQPAQQNGNIIQRYSPELHQFIENEIKSGRSAIQAGALAQNDKRFTQVINKLSKDYKVPWSNILESIYGSEGMAMPNQWQSGMTQDNQSKAALQGQQQQGTGQQALMAILSKINQKLGQ